MTYRTNDAGGQRSIVFVGQSMYPLLHDLDILYMAPYAGQALKKGDVIVFMNKREGQDIFITHRIMAVGDGCFRTKGDNNRYADERPVPAQSIVGRVLYAKRGNRIIKVHGGKRGEAYASIMHARSRAKAATLRLMAYPYHLLSRSGLFRRLLPGSRKWRVIYIKRPNGMESRLMMGRFIIGKRRAGEDKWSLLPPFKLFIDEASLPARLPDQAEDSVQA